MKYPIPRQDYPLGNAVQREIQYSIEQRLPFLERVCGKLDFLVLEWQKGRGPHPEAPVPCRFAAAIREESVWLSELSGKAIEQFSGWQLAPILLSCWHTFMHCYLILEEAERVYFYGNGRVVTSNESWPFYHDQMREILKEAAKILPPAKQ